MPNRTCRRQSSDATDTACPGIRHNTPVQLGQSGTKELFPLGRLHPIRRRAGFVQQLTVYPSALNACAPVIVQLLLGPAAERIKSVYSGAGLGRKRSSRNEEGR